MNRRPQAASRSVELTAGVSAVAPGVLWLHGARAIVAADVHFGYEEVAGGALPAWSTRDIVRALLAAIRSLRASEVVLLGDVIHGSRMSEGTARAVQSGLNALRRAATLTLVAGNHEGRSRGAAILGETVETAERDGWLLLHGDRAPDLGAFAQARGAVIGHLHPSVALGGYATAPAFLAAKRLIVLPALTPYSRGLNVFSDECMRALAPFDVGARSHINVVAATHDRVYPFGALSEMRKVLRQDG